MTAQGIKYVMVVTDSSGGDDVIEHYSTPEARDLRTIEALYGGRQSSTFEEKLWQRRRDALASIGYIAICESYDAQSPVITVRWFQGVMTDGDLEIESNVRRLDSGTHR